MVQVQGPPMESDAPPTVEKVLFFFHFEKSLKNLLNIYSVSHD